MAVIKPTYQNQLEYSGEDERRGSSAPMALDATGVVRTGVIGTVAPSISISGSAVSVGQFSACIGSAKGGYMTGLDSTTSAGTLTSSDPTNPRRDRVVLEVIDPDNFKPGTRGGVLRIITGTPGALPSLPALPALALHVGTINVPASGTGSATVTADARFTMPIGVPIPVRNAAERNEISPLTGTLAYRRDTDTTDFVFNGGWAESYISLPAANGWAFIGGVKKTPEGQGLIRYEFTARMTREISPFTIPAAGNVFFDIIDNWVPPNARPARPIDTFVAVLSNTDLYNGQAVFRIRNNGTVAAVSTGSSIGFPVGGYIQIMATWIR